MARVWTGLVAFAVALVSASSASALTLQPLGSIDPFVSPVYVTSEPADFDRLHVVEQRGTIQLVTPNSTNTFLDIRDLVLSNGEPGSGNEQGLLSVAFPSDFATTQRFYVTYTDATGELQLDEFTASGNVVDPGTRRPVLTIQHPTAQNHNGGQLQFGPDGYLYWSTGDGGTGGALARDLSSLLGKMLRIDPRQSGGSAYTVPADNPFVGIAGADEIWSWGLRNPWRFSFDSATGALLIADVGNAAREEVDFEPPSVGGGRGDDFGWNCREGFIAGPGGCVGTFTDPIFEYANDPSTCAITGGYVSHDNGAPELAGRYFYADLCVGQIRSFIPGLPFASDDRAEGVGVSQPTSFGEDSCGRLYVVSRNGQVFRIVGSSTSTCPPPNPPDVPPPDGDPPPTGRNATEIELHAKDRRVEDGHRVRFSVLVTPCVNRVGDAVRLLENGDSIAKHKLDASCRARFRPRVDSAGRFRASIGEDAANLADLSRIVRISIAR